MVYAILIIRKCHDKTPKGELFESMDCWIEISSKKINIPGTKQALVIPGEGETIKESLYKTLNCFLKIETNYTLLVKPRESCQKKEREILLKSIKKEFQSISNFYVLRGDVCNFMARQEDFLLSERQESASMGWVMS